MSMPKGLTVYIRGKVWYTEFPVGDKIVKRSTRVPAADTRQKAEKVALEIRNRELEKPKQAQTSIMTLSKAIDKAYDEHWSRKKDSENPRIRLETILKITGDIPLDKITSSTISDVRSKLSKRGLSPSTINRYMAALNTLLALARDEWEEIGTKPTIKKYREPKGRIRYLSQKEEEQLLGFVSALGFEEYAQLFAVLVDTGFRFSELNELHWEDVKLNERHIHCWRNKGDRPRTVPMTERVHEILRQRKEAGEDYPFHLSYGKARNLFNKAKKSMGLQDDKDFCIHALRHTCASRLVQAGVDIYTVKEILGHSSVTVTEKYAHLNSDKLRKAMQVLEK